MPAQASLDGFDPPPPPLDRLFFALFPPADMAARVSALGLELQQRHGVKGKPIATGRLHVTLHHIGDFAGLRPDFVDAARQAAASVTTAPFELVFDRVTSFDGRPNQLPLVLRGDAGLASLMAFQQQLANALKKTVLGRTVKGAFTPHVTLTYGDRPVADEAIEPVTWTAQEFVLVHSLIGQGVHRPLGRWPLVG
jgi:2'-5' RNA ligase